MAGCAICNRTDGNANYLRLVVFLVKAQIRPPLSLSPFSLSMSEYCVIDNFCSMMFVSCCGVTFVNILLMSCFFIFFILQINRLNRIRSLDLGSFGLWC